MSKAQNLAVSDGSHLLKRFVNCVNLVPTPKPLDTKTPVVDEQCKKGYKKGVHFLGTSLNPRFF